MEHTHGSPAGLDARPAGPVFSRRIGRLRASVVREILAAAQSNDVISFAGGLPAPECIPAMSLAAVPSTYGQYGLTEGEPELRAAVAEYLRGIGLSCPPERILILSGSQQGIDLCAKLFIDDESVIITESPTYLAALQVFTLFGADVRGVPIGSAWDSRTVERASHGGSPRLAYLCPTFQNPTGNTYDDAARSAIAVELDRLSLPLLEDDPYREVAFDGPAPAPIAGRLERASWVYQSSFSKVFVPGIRLGFLAASADLFPHLVRLKQAADLHASRLSQWLALESLTSTDRERRLAALRQTYRQKRDAFHTALGRHLGGLATWNKPAGGLFFWVELDRQLRVAELLPKAIEKGVVFVPGEVCFPDASPPARGTLRLNFSHASETQIDEGLARLAALLRAAS